MEMMVPECQRLPSQRFFEIFPDSQRIARYPRVGSPALQRREWERGAESKGRLSRIVLRDGAICRFSAGVEASGCSQGGAVLFLGFLSLSFLRFLSSYHCDRCCFWPILGLDFFIHNLSISLAGK